MTTVATRVAPRAAPFGAVGRARQRVGAAIRAVGWNDSWKATVALFGLMVIRMGELWTPVARLKPVFVMAIVLVLLHISRSDAGTWRRAMRNPQVRLTIAYGVLVALLVPTSIWRGKSISVALVMPWMFLLVLLTAMTKPTLVNVDRIARWFGWLTALTALVLIKQGNVVEGSRLTTSGSYDSNDLGGLMALGLPLAIGASTRGPWWSRLFSAGSAAIILKTLLQTGSRGAFLALVASLALLLLALRPQRLVMTMFAAVVLLPIGWQFAPPIMRDRAATLLSLDEDYNTNSNSGRVYLWKRGMVFALQNPLTGVGPGTFEAQLGRDFQETGSRGAWHTAHNTVVQSYAELGLIGGTLLFFIVVRSLMISARFWHYRRAVYRPEFFAAFGGYCVAALFLSHAYSYLLFSVVAWAALLESLAMSGGPGGAGASTNSTPRGGVPVPQNGPPVSMARVATASRYRGQRASAVRL